MKFLNKSLLFFYLLIGTVFYKAEPLPPAPSQPGGGGGGVGPGSPASPIDMYVYILAVAAILLMCYYHYKTRKNIV